MRKIAVLALGAMGVLAAGRPAEAVPISFTTTGTFSSPTAGCTTASGATITCDGYTLTFSSAPTVQDIPLGFTSVVNFGQIAVTGTSSSTITGGGTFNLAITQTVPSPTAGSPFSYSAVLSASLVNDGSGSFLQFAAPFTRTITSSAYDVVYGLTEGDSLTPGRSNISGSGEAPLDINGTISATTVIPEPGSMVLLGTGLLGFVRVARRRFRKN